MHSYILKPDQSTINQLRASVNSWLRVAQIKFDSPENSILEIAPDEHKGAHNTFRNAKVTTLNIKSGADIQADICRSIPGKYDVVICFEVLEHVDNPFEAIKNIHACLKQGGTLYLTTPFFFRIHNPLPDNWRFTKYGINKLLKKFKFVYIEHEGDELKPLHYRTVATK